MLASGVMVSPDRLTEAQRRGSRCAGRSPWRTGEARRCPLTLVETGDDPKEDNLAMAAVARGGDASLGGLFCEEDHGG